MVKEINKGFILKLLLIQIFCGLTSLSLGVKWGISLDLSQYDQRIYKNIIIAGIDVGGLTPNEAHDKVKTEYLDKRLQKTIVLTLEDQLFTASPKTFFTDSDLNEVITKAYSYPLSLNFVEKWFFLLSDQQQQFDVTLNFNDKAAHLFIEDIILKINKDATDAAISIHNDGTIAITPHSNGYIINKRTLLTELKSSLDSSMDSTINLLDYSIKKTPAYTTDLLAYVDTCITSFSTSFTPDTGKATNIKLSAQAINGTFLAPGDTFSFNEILGETTAEKGYKYAPVIVNSRISQGLGGGVCQVSSTLYNAILKTGLYPKNRKPHSKPVNYVPLGLDATVSWNSIDFQFQNTLDYPIYIQSYVKENQIYVNIYSNHTLKNKAYKLKSEVYQVLPPRFQYVSKPGTPSGDKKLVRTGSPGYKVKVTRETYEKDKLQETEVISLDTYPPS